MKKIGCLLICLLFIVQSVAFAQEQPIPEIRITYSVDSVITREASVEAEIVLAYGGQESSICATVKQNDDTLDAIETILPQKSMRIDSDSFCAILFNDGYDACCTKLKSMLCSRFISLGTVEVPTPSRKPVDVFLNGKYWGLYSLRETIEDSIARFEGIHDTAVLHIGNANGQTVFGDISGIAEDFQRVKALNLSLEKDRQLLNEVIDTNSFLNWMVVNTFFGNTNLYGELYIYRVDDGPWKFATGDFAFSFLTASDHSLSRLLNPIIGSALQYEVSALANIMMKEPFFRDAFLTKIGSLYQALPVSLMQETLDAENNLITPVLSAHMGRWANEFIRDVGAENGYPVADVQEALLYQSYCVYRLRDKTLVRRPWYIYDGIQKALDVSEQDMVFYFGGTAPELPQVSGDTWDDYRMKYSGTMK